MSTRTEKLLALRAKWSSCSRCALSRTRSTVVTCRGSIQARLLVIGEAPGKDEDACGKPFVGKAGRTLDQLFRVAGLNPRKDVFVINMVGCRPPGNRKPSLSELQACRPRLTKLLRLSRARCILLLGATAAKLAGVQYVTAWRGRRMEVELPDLPSYDAVVTFHPSYLNRLGGKNDVRQQMVRDIKFAARIALAGSQ